MFGISILRFTGIIFGLIALVIAFFRLRSHVDIRTDVRLLIPSGLVLIVLSVFPGLVNLPAEMFSLRNFPGGRIVTILIFSNLFLWFLFIYERNKSRQNYSQFDKLVRNLSVYEFFNNSLENLKQCPITILIPAYNEADNLLQLLPDIQKQKLKAPARVLVIDDGSTDDTAKVARKFNALVAEVPTNRGGGAALKTGYDIVKKISSKIVVTMDADGQHRPEDINTLIDPIFEDKADLVVGSRILGSSEKYSRFRYFGVRVFSWLIKIIIGKKITDCSSGFRAFNVSVLEECLLIQDQYHTAELIIEAAKRGFRIDEKPIHIKQRLSGESKKGHNVKYALYFLRTIIKSWFR
jgi:hypothetical protein